jgi:hypothetical protein
VTAEAILAAVETGVAVAEGQMACPAAVTERVVAAGVGVEEATEAVGQSDVMLGAVAAAAVTLVAAAKAKATVVAVATAVAERAL